jgi:hypothetical protein
MTWIADGIPALNRRFETTLPGLHIAGYASAMSWGPSMRFIYGTNFAGPFIARNIGHATKTNILFNRPLIKQAA